MDITKEALEIVLIIVGLVGVGFALVVGLFQLMAMTSSKYKDVNDG